MSLPKQAPCESFSRVASYVDALTPVLNLQRLELLRYKAERKKKQYECQWSSIVVPRGVGGVARNQKMLPAKASPAMIENPRR